MTDRTSRVIGYGMLTFLSVIITTPLFAAVADAPAGVLGDSIQILIFSAYPILILWLIYKTIAALL